VVCFFFNFYFFKIFSCRFFLSYGLWLCTCCWFWNAFRLSSALCSRAMCLLTVLLRVKVREQNGHGTRIPWCRCRMWARKLVSYPYNRSQKGHFNFFPATNDTSSVDLIYLSTVHTGTSELHTFNMSPVEICHPIYKNKNAISFLWGFVILLPNILTWIIM
jgi:hypothetical protein